MSLRAIEMQFALHKNDEAGIKQQLLMHKPVSDQTMLAAETDKNTVRERTVSSKTEETNQAAIRDEGRSSEQGMGRNGSPRKKQAVKPQKKPDGRNADHPYKGLHIDLSL